jgi:predicted O-methyltransferase YrrM
MSNPVLHEIFETETVVDANGNKFPLSANISLHEGQFLHDLIVSDLSISKSLEIGCAYGISSLFICNALKDRSNKSHIIIDPFQEKNYKNIGITNLKKAGFDFFTLIEEKSEIAMPKLLQSNPDSIDLIFIDGFHSFDQVLLDFYYANRLLREGGIIVFDDCTYPSVAKVLSYILKYPAYKFYAQMSETIFLKKVVHSIINLFPDSFYSLFLPVVLKNFAERARYTSMVAIQKINSDTRDYKWFRNF